jgi:DNA helicase-2/ATP-dependent DNA helicase PcrA
MMLTEEQKKAVTCDEHLMLTACPGSGKTRVIISKLARCLDEVRGTPRAIACITYTNAAVQEIESRLRHHIQPGDDGYFDICTIHSFCLTHIFRPFSYLVKGYEKGFKVLSRDSADFEKLATAVFSDFRRFDPQFQDFEDFSMLRMDAAGNPVGQGIDRGGLTPEIARAYWEHIQKAGYIDFSNIIFHSVTLLRQRPEVLAYVSSKFAWILVDEFQDTTDLQVELLSLVASQGRTRFLLVGDPYQSIFSFAGARPDLANTLAQAIEARTDLHLSGNFRSSAKILEDANKLCPRVPTMNAVGPDALFGKDSEWQHGESAFDVITDHFLPVLDALKIPVGEAAILAPTWYSLFPLGHRLREFGVTIVGPGARPYRRKSQFAPLAEQVCGYFMEPTSDSIVALERTLFNTVLDLTGRSRFDIFSYEGRCVVFALLQEAERLYKEHIGGVAWLEAAAESFAQILIEKEYLSQAERSLFSSSVEDMKRDMQKNKVDLANLTTDDLGIYASPDSALKLSTIHNAKGREYQAVAIIDAHEGRIPSYLAQTPEGIEEGKRLFYVAVTRAKKFLLYVTDSSNHRNTASRFLKAIADVA